MIPFNAIRGFYDPSVNFELEFDVPLADGEEMPAAEITAYPVASEKTEETPEAQNRRGRREEARFRRLARRLPQEAIIKREASASLFHAPFSKPDGGKP